MHLAAQCGCCQENLRKEFVSSVQNTNHRAVTAKAEEPNSPEHQLCVPKGAFFPPSPSFPLAATEKRKFKDLGMHIFPAPHTYFLSNEVLPTLRNSNSYLLLPLGAVRVQRTSALLSKNVWKSVLEFQSYVNKSSWVKFPWQLQAKLGRVLFVVVLLLHWQTDFQIESGTSVS